MEFLEITPTLTSLRPYGVAEFADGPLTRLRLEPAGKSAPDPCRLLIGEPGAADAVDGADGDFVEARRASLGQFVERLLHRLHVQEAAIIPARSWGDVLAAALMALAADEAWLEVDAEASLQQKTRRPLGFTPREAHVARVMIDALFEHGASPESDVAIVSLVGPLVVEALHPGVVSVWCANAAAAERVKGWAAG